MPRRFKSDSDLSETNGSGLALATLPAKLRLGAWSGLGDALAGPVGPVGVDCALPVRDLRADERGVMLELSNSLIGVACSTFLPTEDEPALAVVRGRRDVDLGELVALEAR